MIGGVVRTKRNKKIMNKEGFKNWVTIDFSIHEDIPVFGAVFKTEKDALKAMTDLQKMKNHTVRIVRCSNGETMFFVAQEESETKDSAYRLKGRPPLDKIETFSRFQSALSKSQKQYMRCMFLENGKVLPAPKGQTVLLELRDCSIQTDHDPMIFDEPHLN